MSKEPLIRKASLRDLPAITRIYNQAVEERASTSDETPRSLADRRRWFAQFDAKHPCWVGVEGGEVAAFGALYAWGPKSGYRFTVENSVYVARAARGRGWGKRMLAHVLKEGRALGHKYVLARVFSHNPASLRLHRKAGFRLIGTQRRVAKLDDRWYDVALMEKHL